MTQPPYLQPFVLPTPEVALERHGTVDLHLPDVPGPWPVVVLVHGGPVPPDRTPTPRDWPVFRGYGAAVAARGALGVTLDHRLHGADAYPMAAADVRAAIELVRADPRVDADRVVLWFFSGGGPLMAPWLRDAPDWLRGVAATYPVVDLPAEWGELDPAYRPVEAVAGARGLPIVLTRAGLERPEFAAGVEAFVAAAEAAGAALSIIDVPNGRHGFDHLDHTGESSAAVSRALDEILALLA